MVNNHYKNHMGHLSFHCNGQHIWVKHLNQLINVMIFVIKEVHIQILTNQVKEIAK